jgi:hypothetical protein
MTRGRGPMCSAELGDVWMDSGTLSRTQAMPSAPQGVDSNSGLSTEEQALLLDPTQLVLDLAGILDPTPISDGTNASISLGRGDWWGAGLSGISAIPFIGDLAKAGKLGRWAETLHKTVALARLRPAFAAKARPVLEQLARLTSRIPEAMLPGFARGAFQRMKRELLAWVGAAHRLPRKQMVDAFLQRWYKDIDELPLPAPGPDRGALWSKLGPKRAGDPGFVHLADDPALSGADLAKRLAEQNGRKTLEKQLEPFGLEHKLDLDAEKLADLVGGPLAWPEFKQLIWSRVSVKYVKSLKGRVVVYVDDAVLKNALRKGEMPVLTTELQELLRRRRSGEGITSIEVRDIFDGTVFEI